MWEKVDDYVRKYDLLREGDAILVGLSGGADSVCLLRYLLAVRERMPVRLFAVHVNHMLREEEADRDEKFARDFCARYQVPFAAVRKDVAAERKKRRCSLEEAGRLVRYACFGELAEQWGCNKIAVAHHKNDLAETVLFRLARGTGVRGLSGIRPVSGPIIRPLLCLEREEIREILRELCAMGPSMAVLTGVWLHEGTLGTACYDAGTGGAELFLTDRIEGFYHGTGDLFASALLGGLLNGASLRDACDTATEFTWRTIETTFEKSPDHRFGPKFECHLPWLAEKMETCRKMVAN